MNATDDERLVARLKAALSYRAAVWISRAMFGGFVVLIVLIVGSAFGAWSTNSSWVNVRAIGVGLVVLMAVYIPVAVALNIKVVSLVGMRAGTDRIPVVFLLVRAMARDVFLPWRSIAESEARSGQRRNSIGGQREHSKIVERGTATGFSNWSSYRACVAMMRWMVLWFFVAIVLLAILVATDRSVSVVFAAFGLMWLIGVAILAVAMGKLAAVVRGVRIAEGGDGVWADVLARCLRDVWARRPRAGG